VISTVPKLLINLGWHESINKSRSFVNYSSIFKVNFEKQLFLTIRKIYHQLELIILYTLKSTEIVKLLFSCIDHKDTVAIFMGI
jgi:hypothetical protein